MHRLTLASLAAAALTSAALSAQTPLNVIGNDPGSVTTVLFGENADLLAPFRIEQFRGLGRVRDASGTLVNRLNGVALVIQDQDTNTQDPFAVVMLPDDGTGQPDSNPANELFRIQAPLLPAGLFGGGTQGVILDLEFNTPIDGLPLDQDFYVGIGTGLAPTFPADGISLQASDESPIGPGATGSFNAFIDRFGPTPIVGSFMPAQLTARAELLVENPALQIGARFDPALMLTVPDPNFGPVGTYRDPLRGDGLTFRIDDAARPNAPGALFVSLQAFSQFPIPLAFLEGELLIDITTLLPGDIPFTLDANGSVEFNVGALPFVRPLGNPGFQVVTLDPLNATLHVSNAQAIIE